MFGEVLKANLATEAIVKGFNVAKDAVVGFAKNAISSGMNFDSSMSKVKAISGATGEDFQKLRDKAQEMGEKTKFSATESADAMTYMAMAGWKTSDMLNGIDGIMNLAAASGEDLATTSDIVTDALTGFGLSAGDATHFADVLAVASSNANTNVGMMGETFKYVAPVAGSLGYSAEDVAESVGLMANSGIKASQAGTSLRSIMTRLSTDAGASSKSLGALGILTEKLGVQFYNSDGTVRDFNDVISESREAWKGLTAEEQQNYAKKIAGQNAISGWNALMNASSEDVEKLHDSLINCDGAAEEMAATMQDNLAGDITLFNSALETLYVNIFDKVSPALRGFVQEGKNGVGDLAKAVKSGDISGAFTAIGTTLSGMGSQFLSLGLDLIKNLTDGIRSGGADLIASGLESLVSFSGSIREGAGQLVDAGLGLIKALADSIISNIPTFIETAPTIISNFAGVINDNAPNVLASGIEIIGKLAAGLIQAIPTLVANIPQILKAIVDVFTAFNWLSIGKTVITAIGNGLKAAGSTLGNALKSAGESASKFFKNVNWAEVGKNAVNLIGNAIKTAGKAISTALKAIGQNAGKAFKEVDWKAVGKAVIEFIKTAASAAGTLVVSALKTIGTNAMNAFKNIDWKSVGKAAITFIKTAASGAGHLAVTALKTVGTKAMDAFKNTDWKGVGKAVIDGIANGIKNFAGTIVSAAKSAAKKALKAAKDFLGIKSPSKVFEVEVGKNIDLGMAKGIERYAGAISNSLDNAVDFDYPAITDFAVGSSSSAVKNVAPGVTINVYGAQGQDVNVLAEIVSRKLNHEVYQQRAAWGTV